MKKLNKKGFTLIELLAVIVVLAIVLVLTIPAVLGSVSDARKQAFAASANSAADWFEKQYAYCSVGDATLSGGAIDSEYLKITKGWDATSSTTNDCTVNEDTAIGETLLKAAGLNATDYSASSSTVEISENGRACVTLVAADDGKFAGQDDAPSSACE